MHYLSSFLPQLCQVCTPIPSSQLKKMKLKKMCPTCKLNKSHPEMLEPGFSSMAADTISYFRAFLLLMKHILSSCLCLTWLSPHQMHIWVNHYCSFPPSLPPIFIRYSSSYWVNLHSNMSDPHLHSTRGFMHFRSKCNSLRKHLTEQVVISSCKCFAPELVSSR